jgi:mRNA-degrading endonuclease HigB of HigAB toxin-antitoxin module
MRVISLRRVREFWERHSDAEEALRVWYKTAEKAEWSSLDDVRKTYSAADCVELDGGRIVTVFGSCPQSGVGLRPPQHGP